MRIARCRSAILGLVVLAAGCASTQGVVHNALDESRPHISWELRAGGDEGERDFVCGSAQPAKPCVLPASTGNNSSLAVAYLTVHAAAQATSYLGFMRASFFEGEGDRKLSEINVIVEPDRHPIGASVLGQVYSKGGSYTLAIAVDAFLAGATLINLGQEVPVVVR